MTGTTEKLYVVDTWDELDDIGQHYVELKLYRTRERAEARVAEIERECDYVGYRSYATVYEFEVVDE